ncbi:hypothetical protein [Bacillus subtilis]|uniref:hypothetical protein n=1 Tax=Bacillus subtilis TaxID=1423 RepID=UPI001F186F83|nr:hypothetical protein [Bacillus subtilis]UJE04114.1 hypothetical protein HNV25_11095 [Bacillus subtilis]
MPYEEYEELKKKTIKIVHKKNYSIRFIEQTNGSDDKEAFYKEIAQFLFERALRKSE